MRIKKSVFAAVLLLTMVVSLAVGATAAGTLQEIKAYLNSGITIKYNGEAQVMTDAQGARVYPITYNGTTYVPIRAVSNMLDVKVDWDQASQTVLLGNPANGVDMIDEIKPYNTQNATVVQSSEKKAQEISGNSCSHWLSLDGFGGRACSASYNLEGKYTSLTFQYYSDMDFTLKVTGDNDAVLAEIPVKGRQVAQTITVNLLSTSQLTFSVDQLWDDGGAYIFDAKLK